MKYTVPLSLIAVCLPMSLSAEVENEIQWGIEGVTGYRTDYVYRGFELSESTLDFQLEAEITLTNNLSLNVGAWYATETGSGEFDESAGFIHLRYYATEQLTLGMSGTYRDFNHSFFKDGLDLGLFASWYFTRDLGVTLGAYYDTGAEGWYGNLETNWSKPVNEKSYVALKVGVSVVDNYYNRDGFNDAYARASFTYNISDTVSITPFVGGSALLDNKDTDGDKAYAGIWFEVSF